MPSQIFSTERVIYGHAPFHGAKLAVNQAAGCVNLIPGKGLPPVCLMKPAAAVKRNAIITRQGQTVRVEIGPAAVHFNSSEEAASFCKSLGIKYQEQAEVSVAPLPEVEVHDAEDGPAPATPPPKAAGQRSTSVSRSPRRDNRWKPPQQQPEKPETTAQDSAEEAAPSTPPLRLKRLRNAPAACGIGSNPDSPPIELGWAPQRRTSRRPSLFEERPRDTPAAVGIDSDSDSPPIDLCWAPRRRASRRPPLAEDEE